VKWILQLLWNPVEALDLSDKDGKVDHGKIIGFFSFILMLGVVALYVVRRGELIPLGHTIALISASFGWTGWRAFLASKAATATEKFDRRDTRISADIEERYPYGPPVSYFEDD
jgi:hypothetical protein